MLTTWRSHCEKTCA